MRWTPVPQGDIRVRRAGDAAVVVELPARLDPDTSARAVAIADAARARLGDIARDVVVGYHTVTVYFDPSATRAEPLLDALEHVAATPPPADVVAGAHLDIPVCYGGAFGPDLAEVARTIGRSEAQVVELHTSLEYRVFVIGFVPGFAYMGPLPEALSSLGRRGTPRTRVPAGSVAIAAGQTGIYPIETPGGWWILGRTPVRLFDPERTPPALFAPGDHVRFRPIGRAEFERLDQA